MSGENDDDINELELLKNELAEFKKLWQQMETDYKATLAQLQTVGKSSEAADQLKAELENLKTEKQSLKDQMEILLEEINELKKSQKASESENPELKEKLKPQSKIRFF